MLEKRVKVCRVSSVGGTLFSLIWCKAFFPSSFICVKIKIKFKNVDCEKMILEIDNPTNQKVMTAIKMNINGHQKEPRQNKNRSAQKKTVPGKLYRKSGIGQKWTKAKKNGSLVNWERHLLKFAFRIFAVKGIKFLNLLIRIHLVNYVPKKNTFFSWTWLELTHFNYDCQLPYRKASTSIDQTFTISSIPFHNLIQQTTPYSRFQ